MQASVDDKINCDRASNSDRDSEQEKKIWQLIIKSYTLFINIMAWVNWINYKKLFNFFFVAFLSKHLLLSVLCTNTIFHRVFRSAIVICLLVFCCCFCARNSPQFCCIKLAASENCIEWYRISLWAIYEFSVKLKKRWKPLSRISYLRFQSDFQI